MTPILDNLEAVILSGPRRGEIITLPAEVPKTGSEEIEALNTVLNELNLALERVSTELRTTLQSLKPIPEA
jgi:hypothetical protein